MKPVVYLTTLEVRCPCGWFLNVRVKNIVIKRTCWKCNRVIEVRPSGSSVTAWCGKEKLEIDVIGQNRQK